MKSPEFKMLAQHEKQTKNMVGLKKQTWSLKQTWGWLIGYFAVSVREKAVRSRNTCYARKTCGSGWEPWFTLVPRASA